jgi:hypothetical protein
VNGAPVHVCALSRRMAAGSSASGQPAFCDYPNPLLQLQACGVTGPTIGQKLADARCITDDGELSALVIDTSKHCQLRGNPEFGRLGINGHHVVAVRLVAPEGASELQVRPNLLVLLKLIRTSSSHAVDP